MRGTFFTFPARVLWLTIVPMNTVFPPAGASPVAEAQPAPSHDPARLGPASGIGAGHWQRRLARFARLDRRLYRLRIGLSTALLLTVAAASFLLQRTLVEPSLAAAPFYGAATLAAAGLLTLPFLVAARRALQRGRHATARRFYRDGVVVDYRDARWTLTDRRSYRVLACHPAAPRGPGAG